MLGRDAFAAPLVVFPVVLVIAATIIGLACLRNPATVEKTESRAMRGLFTRNSAPNMPRLKPAIILAAGGLFLVVVLRSWVGLEFDLPWKAEPVLGFVLICAVVLGKMSGGFISDILRPRRAAICSLIVSAALFIFADYSVAGIAAIFFFNMTMPITLGAISRIFADAKGFAFGLLCFGLFIGSIPDTYGTGAEVPGIGFCIAALISMLIMAFALRGRMGGEANEVSQGSAD
jgi:hypothetical protein